MNGRVHEVLTPADVARILKISRRQVNRLRDIPWRFYGPRTKRVTVDDFERWSDRKRSAAQNTEVLR